MSDMDMERNDVRPSKLCDTPTITIYIRRHAYTRTRTPTQANAHPRRPRAHAHRRRVMVRTPPPNRPPCCIRPRSRLCHVWLTDGYWGSRREECMPVERPVPHRSPTPSSVCNTGAWSSLALRRCYGTGPRCALQEVSCRGPLCTSLSLEQPLGCSIAQGVRCFHTKPFFTRADRHSIWPSSNPPYLQAPYVFPFLVPLAPNPETHPPWWLGGASVSPQYRQQPLVP
jgi:hypothetical protein